VDKNTIVVGVDGWYLSSGRGVGNYQANLVRAIAEAASDIRLVIYAPRPPNLDLERLGCTVRILNAAPYPMWEQMIFPRAVAADRLDLIHCMANTAPLLRRGPTPLILTVHDVMFLSRALGARRGLPVYQRIGGIYRRLIAPRAIRRSAAVIAPSKYSRDQILMRTKVRPDIVHVIHSAAGLGFHKVSRQVAVQNLPRGLTPTQPFIFALGARDPRKNTLGILKAFVEYRRSGGRHLLVIAGLDHWMAARVDRFCLKHRLQSVIPLGFVSSPELIALYNLTTAFLYPSFDEGFGFPILEAMACGAPVITSDRSAIPEIAGNAALLVDPRDFHMIARAISGLVDDQRTRDEMVRRGFERSLSFTWQRAASASVAVYRAALP
jgi:glycosyltransferase involved in cell wall biosynthesis